MLEQIPMTERYKFWIDEVSKLFGGLDICSVQVVVDAETGKEYIIDVCDCSLNLLGESQDGDRRLIADLVWDRMSKFTGTQGNSPNLSNHSRSNSNMDLEKTSLGSNRLTGSQQQQPLGGRAMPTPGANLHSANSSNSSIASSVSSNVSAQVSKKPNEQLNAQTPTWAGGSTAQSLPAQTQQHPQAANVQRPLSNNAAPQAGTAPVRPANTAAARPGPPPPPPQPPQHQQISQPPSRPQATPMHARPPPPAQSQIGVSQPPGTGTTPTANPEDSEDTMNNLRKTFAGIFGNSNLI
jgi:hypothetical protein